MKCLASIGASLAMSSAFAGAPDISHVAAEAVSTINGDIEIGDDSRALYISERATIGPIDGAKPVFYSGERPDADPP